MTNEIVDINLWEIKNGKSEFENAKMIISILIQKAIFENKDLKIVLSHQSPEEGWKDRRMKDKMWRWDK